MQALRQPGRQILDGFADRDLSAGIATFLFLDFLEVTMNRGFRASITKLDADGVNGRMASNRQQIVPCSDDF